MKLDSSRRDYHIAVSSTIAHRIVLRALPFFATIPFVAGCTQAEWNEMWGQKPKSEQPLAVSRPPSSSLSAQDTIAPLVTLDGLRLTQVRGYGLVVDLVKTGGRDGPEQVRDYITKEIRRRQEVGAPGVPPDALLGSRDAATVELMGYMPSGAQEGDSFDLAVTALGSECESLVGGRLALGELKLYAESASGVMASKTLASASGPVFVTPFDRHGEPSDKVDLRRGMILGGGSVKVPRTIRIILNNPSYSQAKMIEQRLNGRYAPTDSICKGLSPSTLELTIPREYRQRKSLFLSRILHTTLRGDTTFLQQRARDLCAEFSDAKANLDTIGLALEAVGKLALPEIQRLYASSSEEVRFYVGRTAIRLDERDGVEIVARFAADPGSKHRIEAIEELGWALRQYSAGEALKKLLDDPDEKIRIAAYKALRRRSHAAIETRILDVDNVAMDIIDSSGPFLIYMQRTEAPRIAIFGKSMKCGTPLIFPADRKDGRVMLTQLSAQQGDDHMTLVYTNKRNGKISPPQEAPLNVAELIEYLAGSPTRDENNKVSGLAVPYSEICDIISTFCEKDMGVIPAKLVVESLDDSEKPSQERPESEF